MQPLGRNLGSYHGERIVPADLLGECVEAAHLHGWRMEMILDGAELELLALLHHDSEQPKPRVYISTGIHGDEPAGPAALLELLRSDLLPHHLDYWLCPCLNPAGFNLNSRANPDGIDLNRDYRNPSSREVRAHIAWLERQPRFDLALCLHEDWESKGFYLYELNPDGHPSLASAMVEAIRHVCPIDGSPEIEGRAAMGGVIRPSLDPALRPDWPEAFYLIQHKTRLSYTLESPSDFPLETRVQALVTAVQTALAAWAP